MTMRETCRTQRTEAAFDGFPYLLTRVAPSVYHIAVLPVDLSVDRLLEVARIQIGANKLDTCLVLGQASCVYFDPDGSERPSASIPCGAMVFSDRLHLCERFLASAELSQRQDRLRAYASPWSSGCIVSNPSTVASPGGLKRCRTCGDWRGKTICCYCDNDTLCARCGHPLADRRVNANYWDGGVRHVPGFQAFVHECTVFTISEQEVVGCMISSGVVLSVEAEGRKWLLNIKGDEGYEDEVGPVGAAGLVEELELRGYRVGPFLEGLRSYGEAKLNRLARRMQRCLP